ncbi:MAG: universal stress protein [Alphaproteobacteria bacterium]|nr:universal stress protein [Alphaproteobacteria bacterium]NNF24117.1 universal stress protein [Paracoccaceae bacterium]
MFQHIMAPVDLGHLSKLTRALAITAEEAKHHGARVTFVAATTPSPSPVAHNPEEFGRKLGGFVADFAAQHGITAAAHPIISHDPVTDIDDVLLKAIDEIGADLVIMASHKPGLADYFWPSNGGKIASHTGASIMLVRDA